MSTELPDSIDEFIDESQRETGTCKNCHEEVDERYLEDGECIGCRKWPLATDGGVQTKLPDVATKSSKTTEEVVAHKSLHKSKCYHRDNGEGEPDCEIAKSPGVYKRYDINNPDISHLPPCDHCYGERVANNQGLRIGSGAMLNVGRARTIRDAIIDKCGKDPNPDELPGKGELVDLTGIGPDSINQAAEVHDWLIHEKPAGAKNYINVSEKGVKAYDEPGLVHFERALSGVDIEQMEEIRRGQS